jgi:hypothetical protein
VQADWLRSLHNNNGSDGRKGLSPIEHKWLARILMKKMQFGLVRLSWFRLYTRPALLFLGVFSF